MAELFGLLLVVATIFAVIAAVVVSVRWILRPVDQAAKDLQRPTQFTIVDFFCLFFVLQSYMAATHWFVDDTVVSQMGTNWLWILDGYGWFAFGSMWGVSVQKLSRAGISHTWHRAGFLALILPVALLCSIAAPFLTIACVVRPFDRDSLNTTYLILLGGTAVCITAIVLAGYYTRWMVAASRPVES